MARIRTVKPEFFNSPDIAALPLLARYTFIGLWTHCDDSGRCLDEPRLIHPALFALDGGVSVDEVERACDALHRGGQILRYTHGTRRYIQIAKWHHQKISHPSPSKLPAHTDDASVLLTPHSGKNPEASVSPPDSFRSDQVSGSREWNRDQVSVARPGGLPLSETIEMYRPATRAEDVWQALEHELGLAQTSTEKSIRGKTLKELKALNATPGEVHERCTNYRVTYPSMPLTDSALLKHWSALREAKVTPARMNPGTAAIFTTAKRLGIA